MDVMCFSYDRFSAAALNLSVFLFPMQSHPMLTSHLLVFISCSSAICNHPRLLMLQQAGVMAQGAVRAEVEGWGHALGQFWEKSNSAEHGQST